MNCTDYFNTLRPFPVQLGLGGKLGIQSFVALTVQSLTQYQEFTQLQTAKPKNEAVHEPVVPPANVTQLQQKILVSQGQIPKS